MSPPPSVSPRTWRIVFGVLLLVRLPAVLVPKLFDDEQVYGVVAREMLKGGQPYLTAIERKPPLLFSLYASVLEVAGARDWVALHLLAIIWTAATMAAVYWILSRRFDRETGLVGAALYGVYGMFGDYRNLALNGELLMNLPIVAALGLTLYPTRNRWRPELLLAGSLIGLATLIKQPAGIAGAALGLYVLAPAYRESRGLVVVSSLWQAAELLAGLLLTFAVADVVLSREGILHEALYWSLKNHEDIVGATTLHYWWRAGTGSWLWAVECSPLILASIVTLRPRTFEATWRENRAEYQALVILFWVSVVAVSINGQFLLHYYLQLLPPLALLSAPVITRWLRQDVTMGPPSRSLIVAAGVATLALFTTVDSIGLWRNHRVSAAGTWVRAHSDPEDRVFVWGQGNRKTGMYLDADRRPATRFISPFPLTGHVFGGYPQEWGPAYEDTRVLPGAWDTLSSDFARHQPRFIIDAESPTSDTKYPVSRYPALRELLQAGYRQVDSATDGIVYERRTLIRHNSAAGPNRHSDTSDQRPRPGL